MDLKPVDEKILKVLLENSRLSYREIARKIKVSVATVMHHVQAMEKEGIIKGYGVHLDYEQLGYDVQVIVDVRISKGKLDTVAKKLRMHKNVFAIYDNTGHFDVTVIAKFKNRTSMNTFLKNIQTYEHIERTETKLILKIIKEEPISL